MGSDDVVSVTWNVIVMQNGRTVGGNGSGFVIGGGLEVNATLNGDGGGYDDAYGGVE